MIKYIKERNKNTGKDNDFKRLGRCEKELYVTLKMENTFIY